MTYQDFIQYYGGNKVKAAACVGVNPVTITNWEKKNEIPYLKQLAIQTLTKNKLKASQ